MDKLIDININFEEVEQIRIRVNGIEYMLTPVESSSQETGIEKRVTLAEYVRQQVDDLKSFGRQRTAEIYRSALNEFLRFVSDTAKMGWLPWNQRGFQCLRFLSASTLPVWSRYAVLRRAKRQSRAEQNGLSHD